MAVCETASPPVVRGLTATGSACPAEARMYCSTCWPWPDPPWPKRPGNRTSSCTSPTGTALGRHGWDRPYRDRNCWPGAQLTTSSRANSAAASATPTSSRSG